MAFRGDLPQCEPVPCEHNIPESEVYRHNCSNVRAGGHCECECAPGFAGRQEVFQCQSDSTLQGSCPECEAVRCPARSHPRVTDTCSEATVNSTCFAVCRPGYEGVMQEWKCMLGSAVTGGQLSLSLVGPTPWCKALPCIYNMPIGLQYFHDCAGVTTGGTCRVHCAEDFVGESEDLVCDETGRFNGSWPFCTPVPRDATRTTTQTSTTRSTTTTTSVQGTSTQATDVVTTTHMPTTTSASGAFASSTSMPPSPQVAVTIEGHMNVTMHNAGILIQDTDIIDAFKEVLADRVGMPSRLVIVELEQQVVLPEGNVQAVYAIHVPISSYMPSDITTNVHSVKEAIEALSSLTANTTTGLLATSIASRISDRDIHLIVQSLSVSVVTVHHPGANSTTTTAEVTAIVAAKLTGAMILAVSQAQAFLADEQVNLALVKTIAALTDIPVGDVSVTVASLDRRLSGLRRMEESNARKVLVTYVLELPPGTPESVRIHSEAVKSTVASASPEFATQLIIFSLNVAVGAGTYDVIVQSLSDLEVSFEEASSTSGKYKRIDSGDVDAAQSGFFGSMAAVVWIVLISSGGCCAVVLAMSGCRGRNAIPDDEPPIKSQDPFFCSGVEEQDGLEAMPHGDFIVAVPGMDGDDAGCSGTAARVMPEWKPATRSDLQADSGPSAPWWTSLHAGTVNAADSCEESGASASEASPRRHRSRRRSTSKERRRRKEEVASRSDVTSHSF